MPSTSNIVRAAVLAGAASAATLDLQPRQTNTCADVHIFLGKGNNEPYPGRQGKLVEAICKGISGSCDYEDILYTNPQGYNYCESVTEGGRNGMAQILAYNNRCPNSKLVVSGFSQGAHIVGDLFAGGNGGNYFECQAPALPNLEIGSKAGRQIAAILTFGDVRHTANQPYNYLGGATRHGAIPRVPSQLANAINYAGVWRDYCNTNDQVCASGNSVPEHLDYFERYTEDAAAFVQQKVREATAVPPTSVPKPPTSESKPPVAGPTTTKAPGYYPTITPPHQNSTISWTETTVTVSGTVTSYITVCPSTTSYVPEPTKETATYECSGTLPLPEATHPVPAVTPEVKCPGGCGSAKPTGSVPAPPKGEVPVTAGASTVVPGLVGMVGLFMAALL